MQVLSLDELELVSGGCDMYCIVVVGSYNRPEGGGGLLSGGGRKDNWSDCLPTEP